MKRREVPLGADGRGMIAPWLAKAKGTYLFPGSQAENHLSPRTVQDMIKKYAYQAQLDPEKVTPRCGIRLRQDFSGLAWVL